MITESGGPILAVVTSEVLRREAASLVARLRLWAPARWSAAAPDEAQVSGTRGDLTFHLAASYARLAGPPVPLPRLDSDLALADQLAVTGDDLARSAPPAARVVDAVAHLLLHRQHLLGEAVPQGLLAELETLDRSGPSSSRPDGQALLRRARRVCQAASAELEGPS